MSAKLIEIVLITKGYLLNLSKVIKELAGQRELKNYINRLECTENILLLYKLIIYQGYRMH